MKKIFKLFLCLLMLVSFTNIAKALGEENYVSALDVANNFNKTNLIEGLLIEAKREDPNASLDISIDEENHTFSIVDDEEESEFEMVFHYNDEYISYTGKTVETPEDVDFGRAMAESVYLENLILSVLDTMDYNDVEIQVDDEFEPNEEFYNQYGILVETQDYSFEDEDGSLSGTSIKEFRISLDKTKIASAVEKYGMERTDYVKLFSSILHTPELTIKKKGANVVVSWPEDENATSFIVYRADKRDGKYTKLGTVKTNSYTDKKVKYGKTYYYKVKAVGENESLTSEIVKFKVAPAKVKNVKVSSVKSTSVKISYDKLSETGYVIERSTDNKKWTVVKTITKNSTLSFNSTGLKANKTYYFRVRAYKSVSGKKVYGGYSDVVSVRTAPSAPKFTIANDTFQSLKLSITGVKGASKYIIYRSTSKKGTYKKIGETSGKNYYDYDLTLGRTYYYKVKSCNNDNKCSDNSSVVSKKVALVKPKITLETGKTIPMTINFKNINMVDGIEIYRSTKKNGTYKRIKTVDGFSNKYVDETTKTKTTYYYKVRTFVEINGKKNYSAYSDIKSLTSLYVEPKIEKIAAKNASDFNGVYKKGDLTLKIYAKSDEQVDVRLTSEASFAGYVLEFKTDELYTDSFGSKYKIVLVDGGVYFKSSESSETGEYSKTEEYGLDDYFADVLGTTSFMDTKYNGYFESSDGDKLYLFQNQEDTVMMDAQMGESYVGNTLNINATNATGEIFESSYELEVNDGVATLKCYEDGTLKYTTTFTRVSDLTKKQIVDIFAL